MEYIKVDWRHDFDDEPVAFLSELGDDRYEVRKVQVYRDGHLEWADESRETATAGLSEIAFPSLEEIAEQPDCVPSVIAAEEFERYWDRARSGTAAP